MFDICFVACLLLCLLCHVTGCAMPGSILFLLYTSCALQQLLSRAFGLQVRHHSDPAPHEHVTASGRLDHAKHIGGSPQLQRALVFERPVCSPGQLYTANLHCSIPVSKPIFTCPNCDSTKLTVGR